MKRILLATILIFVSSLSYGDPGTKFTYSFTETVTGGAATSETITLPKDLRECNAIEASLLVTAVTGAGTTPTLDVKLQGAMDTFVTTNLTKDLITFTQVTTSTAGETKVVKWTTSGPVFFGDEFRLLIAADCDSGSKVYTGKIYVRGIRD